MPGDQPLIGMQDDPIMKFLQLLGSYAFQSGTGNGGLGSNLGSAGAGGTLGAFGGFGGFGGGTGGSGTSTSTSATPTVA